MKELRNCITCATGTFTAKTTSIRKNCSSRCSKIHYELMHNTWSRIHSMSPETKEKNRIRRQLPENKEKSRQRQATPEYKAKRKLYNETAAAKLARFKYESQPGYKEKRREQHLKRQEAKV